MFTGLIEKVGRLVSLARTAEGGRITVRCDAWPEPLVDGESVAVQGACLTVVERGASGFVCDVLGETLGRTTLGGRAVGSLLNLERAMRADGRFGGHMVTGHVDGTGHVIGVRSTGRDWELAVGCGADLCEGLVFKGSVTIDGVSLTIASVRPDGFTVNIIPFTWEHTSLRGLREGEAVNLETDIVGKYVRNYLRGTDSSRGSVTLEKLFAAGFGQ
jgi:riboflavin synthase